jgi:hypothetical protein
MKFSFVCWLLICLCALPNVDTVYNCRAAGAAIILMVAPTRKEKVWSRAQFSRENHLNLKGFCEFSE